MCVEANWSAHHCGYKEGHHHGYEKGYEFSHREADNWWIRIEDQADLARRKIRREEAQP
jgi:hypothetical protein